MKLLVIVIIIAIAEAHRTIRAVSSFTIASQDKAPEYSFDARLQEDIACVLSFHTSETKVNIENIKENNDGWAEVKRYTDGEWKSQCLEMQMDYWTYELCWDQGIRQYHNKESYLLGAFQSIDDEKHILNFNNGDICDALKHKPARQSIVEFICDPSKNKPKLTVIDEDSMCQYRAIVATSIVCGDPRFPIDMHELEVDDDEEHWLVELSRTSDGGLFCKAYGHSDTDSGGKVFFDWMYLELHVSSLSDVKCDYVTREWNRKSHIDDAFGDELDNGVYRVRSLGLGDDKFNGRVSYMDALCVSGDNH